MANKKAEQRTAEWFEQRRHKITGSRVGAILGLSPFSTASKVMQEMIDDYKGKLKPLESNPALDYGVYNEPNALASFIKKTGFKVKEAFFEVSKEYDWLGASPDGYIGSKSLVELKCPFGKKDSDDFKSIKEQPHYYAQIQTQLLVTGRNKCYFYQWSPVGEKIETVKADPKWVEMFIPKLKEFYDKYLELRDANFSNADKLIEDYKNNKNKIKAIEEDNAKILEELLAITNHENYKCEAGQLFKTEKAGSISYANIVKEHLPNLDLTPYRGKASISWGIK